jgi:hypothetical protein
MLHPENSNDMIKNIKILGLLAILILTGCEKDKNEFPSGTYLKRVIYHQNVDQIRHYYYNDQGLLSTREYEFNDIISERFEYQYENRKIKRIDYYGFNSYDDYTLYHKDYLVFDYESNNIIKATRFPDQHVMTYQYDDIGRLINSNADYEYDNNDNLIKIISYKDGEIYRKIYREYDSKSNPFYKVDPIHDHFSGVDFLHYSSPNNLIKELETNKNGDTLFFSEFVYEYEGSYPTLSYELYTDRINGYERDSMHTQLYEYEIK